MNITDNYWESITKKSNVLFVKSIKVQYRIIKLFILLVYQEKSFFIDKVNSNAKLSTGDQMICLK